MNSPGLNHLESANSLMRPTHELVQTPLFKIHSEGLPLNERIALTYERAKAIGAAYGIFMFL
jgi:hypothetical protein